MLELGARRAQIQAVVENVGFDALYSALYGVVDLSDCFITHRVVEQFSYTTDRFHLPSDEMAIISPIIFWRI